MIYKDTHNLLFHEWCEENVTERRRAQLFSKLHGVLYQMGKATLRKRHRGFNFNEENNMIEDCVNTVMLKSIGNYNKELKFNSFSFIHTLMINHYMNELVNSPRLNKNSMFNYKNQEVEDNEFIESKGYDNLFISPSFDEEDDTVTIDDVLMRIAELISEVEAIILKKKNEGKTHFKRLNDKLLYLNKVYEYIDKFENINYYNFNEWIFDNTYMGLNTIIWFSREFFNVEGNFKKHNPTKKEFKNNMTRKK